MSLVQLLLQRGRLGLSPFPLLGQSAFSVGLQRLALLRPFLLGRLPLGLPSGARFLRLSGSFLACRFQLLRGLGQRSFKLGLFGPERIGLFLGCLTLGVE